MIVTNPNENQTVFWAESTMENPLMITGEKNYIVLHQQKDTVYIDQDILEEVIKVLKQYKNPF